MRLHPSRKKRAWHVPGSRGEGAEERSLQRAAGWAQCPSDLPPGSCAPPPPGTPAAGHARTLQLKTLPVQTSRPAARNTQGLRSQLLYLFMHCLLRTILFSLFLAAAEDPHYVTCTCPAQCLPTLMPGGVSMVRLARASGGAHIRPGLVAHHGRPQRHHAHISGWPLQRCPNPSQAGQAATQAVPSGDDLGWRRPAAELPQHLPAPDPRVHSLRLRPVSDGTTSKGQISVGPLSVQSHIPRNCPTYQHTPKQRPASACHGLKKVSCLVSCL